MFTFIQRLEKNSRAILYTCFFAFVCNGVYSLTLGSVMPDLKAAYHLSDTVSGLLLSAHSAGNMIAGFVSALIPLYLGERRAITLLAFLMVTGILMAILYGNPIWLLIGFLFVGFGRGSISNFNNRMVNQLSGGSPAASNLLHSSFAVGAIAAPMLFLAMRNAMGWRAALGAVVLIGLSGVFSLSRMKLENDRPDRRDKANRSLLFMKNPSFLIQASMMFCYLCCEYAINGWLVTYIQSKEALLSSFGVSGAELTAAITSYSQSMATLLWIVILLGRLTCAALSARFSQKRMMLAASIGVAVFYGFMLVGSTIPAVTLCVAGLGFCMAGICPMIYSDAAVFTNTYPLATSFLLAIGSSGAILMPTLVGALAERFGFEGGMLAIFAAIVLLVLFALLNAVLRMRLPEEARMEG